MILAASCGEIQVSYHRADIDFRQILADNRSHDLRFLILVDYNRVVSSWNLQLEEQTGKADG